jgi:hypothetical protein
MSSTVFLNAGFVPSMARRGKNSVHRFHGFDESGSSHDISPAVIWRRAEAFRRVPVGTKGSANQRRAKSVLGRCPDFSTLVFFSHMTQA